MKPKKCVCGEKLPTGTPQEKNYNTLCNTCYERFNELEKKVKDKTATNEDFNEMLKMLGKGAKK